MIKVAVLTSAHIRFDTRIYAKQCISLAKHYQVSLIVADNKGDENIDGIHVYDVGKQQGKFKRAFCTTRRILRKALELDAEIYHLHDPELLTIALKLKKHGKKVIFDMHEDLPVQISLKIYLPKLSRTPIKYLYQCYERYVFKKIDGVIFVQDFLKDKYQHNNTPDKVIGNSVIIDTSTEPQNKQLNKNLIYAGALNQSRGLFNMLNLLEKLPDYKLHLAGPFNPASQLEMAKTHPAWPRVQYHGYLAKPALIELYSQCSFGLILFENIGQYHHCRAVKLFEYMANKLLILMPNFGEWAPFNKEHDCAINVQTNDAQAIADTILAVNQQQFEALTTIAYQCTITHYSWEKEEKKLLDFYKKLTN